MYMKNTCQYMDDTHNMIVLWSVVFVALTNFLRDGVTAMTTHSMTHPVTTSMNATDIVTYVTVTESGTEHSSVNTPTVNDSSDSSTMTSTDLISDQVTSVSSHVSYPPPERTHVHVATLTKSNTRHAIEETSTASLSNDTKPYITTEVTSVDASNETRGPMATTHGPDTNMTSYSTLVTDTVVTTAWDGNNTTVAPGHSQEVTKTTISTIPSENSTNEDTADRRCFQTTVIVIGVASAVVAGVIVIFVVCFLKKRMKWKKKIVNERLKTDIWTTQTLNNTIVNDNFFDFKLAPSPDEPRRNSNGASVSGASMRSSQSQASSLFSDVSTFGTSLNKANRRSTLCGAEKAMVYPTKGTVKRPSLCYSNDSVLDPVSLEFSQSVRSKTSTFMGKRDARKSNDKHTLVEHDELVFDSGDCHPGLARNATTEL